MEPGKDKKQLTKLHRVRKYKYLQFNLTNLLEENIKQFTPNVLNTQSTHMVNFFSKSTPEKCSHCNINFTIAHILERPCVRS